MDYMTLPGASVKMFKKGETLINQGEAIRYVYYLIDGIVHRNVLTERGWETTLTIKSDHMKHEIEAVIGVLFIYSAEVDQPKVAQSSFIAKTDCKCIQIPVQSFLKYAYQDRDTLESIVRYALAAVLGGLFLGMTRKYAVDYSIEPALMGNIMLVIPGIPFTNAIRDMLNGDTMSGMLRMSESLLRTIALAAGFVGALTILGQI